MEASTLTVGMEMCPTCLSFPRETGKLIRCNPDQTVFL